MRKKPLKTEWAGLFDPGEIAHVRDLLRDLATSERPTTEVDARPLERHLLAPLDAFFRGHAGENHIGIDAARNFSAVVCDIIDRAKENKPRATDGDTLAKAWKEFINANAAHLVYSATANRSRNIENKNSENRRKNALRDARIIDLLRNQKHSQKEIARLVKQEFPDLPGLSTRQIRNIRDRN